jgi:N-acetylglucosamine kinase-like BadF-type ATPase
MIDHGRYNMPELDWIMFMVNIPSRTSGPGLPERLPAGIPGSPSGSLLGIDAGGSATRMVIVADDAIHWRGSAPPMNARLTGDLEDRLLALIKPTDVTGVGIGMPGLRSAREAADLGRSLTERAGRPVYITNDGITTWLGAFGTEPGIVVYAGTGSGAVGCDGTRWARAGGHGFVLGDEGGAYWIGRAAVNAALRWSDGLGAGSRALHDAIDSIADLDTQVRDVTSHPAERDRITRFAPIVTELAATDEAARDIALRAAGHLADLADAIRRVLGPLPVAGTGGVLGDPLIWAEFEARTGASRPLAPPEVGAALLAATPRAREAVAGDPVRLADHG